MKHRHTPRRRRAHPIGPMPAAARLIMIGEWLILLATCDFAARLLSAEAAGEVGAIYRLSDFGGAVSATAVIIVAAAVALDYWERTLPPK